MYLIQLKTGFTIFAGPEHKPSFFLAFLFFKCVPHILKKGTT